MMTFIKIDRLLICLIICRSCNFDQIRSLLLRYVHAHVNNKDGAFYYSLTYMFIPDVNLFVKIDDAHEDASLLFATHTLQNTLGYYDNSSSPVLGFEVGDKFLEVTQRLDYQKHGRGVTGAVLWSTTPLVLKYLLSCAWFTGSLDPRTTNVLELGSGIGVLPLVMEPHCNVFVASDHDHELLKLIKKNCASMQNLAILELDWTDEPFSYINNLKEEVNELQYVMCLDCIYSDYLAAQLVKTLVAISNHYQDVSIIVGQQLRDESVHLEFLEAALEHFIIWRLKTNEEADQKEHEKMQVLDGYILLILKRRTSKAIDL